MYEQDYTRSLFEAQLKSGTSSNIAGEKSGGTSRRKPVPCAENGIVARLPGGGRYQEFGRSLALAVSARVAECPDGSLLVVSWLSSSSYPW